MGKRNTLFIASTTSYIINFNKKNSVFTLTSTKDELKVDAKHKKYEWLKSQDAGRIVKISDKGRWNSSKDYIGLYDEINSSKSKKKSTVKTTKRKTKSAEAIPSSLKINELATLKETILHLKNKLQVREKEWKGLLKAKEYDKHVIYQLKQLGSEQKKEIQLLKTKSTSLRNEIQLLKKKPQPAKPKPKPKPVKKEPKQYMARITATLKYFHRFYDRNESKNLDITIITKRQFKKPSQSFFKSYLKFAAADGYNYSGKWPHYGLPIESVSGCSAISSEVLAQKQKITNISFIYIREY